MAVITLTQHHVVGHVRKLVFAIAADATGAVPETDLPSFAGAILSLRTVPSRPQPTPFDVSLIDDLGADVLGALGMDRSGCATEHTLIAHAGTHPLIDDYETLRLHVTGVTPHAGFALEIVYGAD
ncbi:MAG: hypothetical protein HYX76_10120 [Acidobacteria bacterium]|nr:hypothetical protein [Acidobacteriota bacterium]